jgi:hypothetical protein
VPGEPQVGEGGRLVDDRVGLGFEDRPADGVRVEDVEGDRLGAQRPEPVTVGPVGADHLVPAIDELSDEPGADGAARSCYEHSHRAVSFRSGHIARGWRVYRYDPIRRSDVTDG